MGGKKGLELPGTEWHHLRRLPPAGQGQGEGDGEQEGGGEGEGGDGEGEGEGEMPDINIQRLGREERRSWYRNIGSGLWSGLSMTQPSVSGMGMTQTGQRFSCSCM